ACLISGRPLEDLVYERGAQSRHDRRCDRWRACIEGQDVRPAAPGRQMASRVSPSDLAICYAGTAAAARGGAGAGRGDRSRGGESIAMKTYAWLILTALSLSACADSSEMSQKDLSLACEFRKCDCARDNQSFAGQAVQWQQDGSA